MVLRHWLPTRLETQAVVNEPSADRARRPLGFLIVAKTSAAPGWQLAVSS